MSAVLIDRFLEVMLAEKGISQNTRLSYQTDLFDFHAFLESRQKKLQKASPDDVKDYMAQLCKHHLSARTQSRRLSALREFYNFCLSENVIKKNPLTYIKTPKTPQALPKYLSERDITALIETAEQKDRRLYTLLELLYASGMRVSELVGLPVLSLEENIRHIYVRGKGNKERIVPLNESASRALHTWLVFRETSSATKGRPSKWLFPSASRSGHLTRDGFFKALKKIALEAGIDAVKVSPHVFRHSFASHLIAHDADLRSVQQMLGHADIATTQIYTHILEDRLKKTVEKSHPLAYSKELKGFR